MRAALGVARERRAEVKAVPPNAVAADARWRNIPGWAPRAHIVEKRGPVGRGCPPYDELLRNQRFLKPYRVFHTPVIAHANAYFVEPELLVKRARLMVA